MFVEKNYLSSDCGSMAGNDTCGKDLGEVRNTRLERDCKSREKK